MLHVKRRHPRIPFVFVTAVHDTEVREDALRNGADGYLLEPFEREELLATVRRVLEKSSA